MAPTGAIRKAKIRALKDGNDSLWTDYQHASGRVLAATSIVRSGEIYSQLNAGKLNFFKLFVERAFQLAKPRGMVGVLTPSGIASDQSSSGFIRRVTTGGHLKALYDFENKKVFFRDVHASFKFCTLIASPERTFPAAKCAFFLRHTGEIADPDRAFPITAEEFARVNPNTGTAPIFRSQRDMALTTAIYERLPVLIDRSGDVPLAAWPVRYGQMLNVTSDSHLFRTKTELEESEGAWSIGSNRFQSAKGEWVPLYEGKMVQAFDHRAASVVVNPNNLKRPAQPVESTSAQHADPAWLPNPQFWVSENAHPLATLGWTISYKIVSSPTNMRTLIGAILPRSGVGNSMGIVVPSDLKVSFGATGSNLLANLNSFVLDFVLRQKIQGQNINWFIVEQLPVIPPAAYARIFGPKSAADIVREAVLELSYTAHDLAPFARDLDYLDATGDVLPPFIWDEERRLHLRAKLDALYFILYGVFDPSDAGKSRDDVRYIYSTFPIVERGEIARWGSYRSRDLCLAWINALMAGLPDARVT